MTQLARELKATLQIQEQILKEEIQSVSASYEKSLTEIVKAYRWQMSEAMQVIKKQSDTIAKQSQLLSRYENELGEVEISLRQEPLMALESQLNALHDRLDTLEKQDSDLVEQLNSVLTKL